VKPIACDCEKCKTMCQHSTCLPTPEGARALIRAGHGARLATYLLATDAGLRRFVGPAPAGLEGAADVPNTRGRCTFATDAGCELHASGLKPLEGQLAHHSRPWLPIRMQVGGEWRGRQFESVSAMLRRAA
jgi:hypothetical protein